MDLMNNSLKTGVFNAARDGKLLKLKTFLDKRSHAETSQLVLAKTNGATSLIMAAKNGHLPCVEYLVDKCNADVEQVGSVVFDGETIDGAPPLWCAAAAGHLDVVAFLLEKQANVNATTKTNSTPLRAACFDGHFNIVKYLVDNTADIEVANRHGHTCLMIACFKGHYDIAKFLIESKADVNRKSVKGNTALHDCAESGSLNIMKLLLGNNAKMDVDSYGMNPLLAAAVTGHTHIVEYLISREEIVKKKDKIDALELLGATYVDKKRDMLGALKFWKTAMELRYENGVMVYKKPRQPEPVSAYENSTEVLSVESLDEIISDPDEMRMQALLMRERILGPAHPDTSYYIRYRGAVYADTGNFDRCIILWMYALEMQQKILEPLSSMTQSSFVSFAELFSFMMTEDKSRESSTSLISFCDIMRVFNKCMNEIEVGMNQINKMSNINGVSSNNFTNGKNNGGCGSRNALSTVNTYVGNSNQNTISGNTNCINAGERDVNYFHRTLVIALHFICLLIKLSGHLTTLQKETLRRAVYKLVKLNPRGTNGVTPLHLACSREYTASVGRFPICNFPSYEVVDILLEVGADPNARDVYGQTPLMTLGNNKFCCPGIVRLLLENGAHLDNINNLGQTLESIRASRGQQMHQLVNKLQYTSLQCLAAITLRKYDLPYAGIIHPRLVQFVDQH